MSKKENKEKNQFEKLVERVDKLEKQMKVLVDIKRAQGVKI